MNTSTSLTNYQAHIAALPHFMTPDERELQNLIQKLVDFKKQYSCSSHVILLHRCTDCLRVTAPNFQNIPEVRKFNYDQMGLNMALCFLENSINLKGNSI